MSRWYVYKLSYHITSHEVQLSHVASQLVDGPLLFSRVSHVVESFSVHPWCCIPWSSAGVMWTRFYCVINSYQLTVPVCKGSSSAEWFINHHCPTSEWVISTHCCCLLSCEFLAVGCHWLFWLWCIDVQKHCRRWRSWDKDMLVMTRWNARSVYHMSYDVSK